MRNLVSIFLIVLLLSLSSCVNHEEIQGTLGITETSVVNQQELPAITPTSEENWSPEFVGPIAHFEAGNQIFPFVVIYPIFEQPLEDHILDDLIRTASEHGFTVIETGFIVDQHQLEQRRDFDRFVYYASKYNMRVIASLFHGEDLETRDMIEGDQEAIAIIKKNIHESINAVNSITGIPYNEDPTIMAWGFRDIGSLQIEGTDWIWDEEDYSYTGAEVRDLVELFAYEFKSNAPNQLVFASISHFFQGMEFDYELNQPGWMTVQDVPSVDFWYWYVDPKYDYWGPSYTSPDSLLVGSVPFSKPFIAVLDPYMSHETQIDAGLYTFDTLCTDDVWRSTQMQLATQFFIDEVGIAGIGLYQWVSDLQWDMLMEVDKCFGITPKNPLVIKIFREYAENNGWIPAKSWDQEAFVTVVYDLDPADISRRTWSDDFMLNWRTHLVTYRTIYDQVMITSLGEAEAILLGEADLGLSKSRLQYWRECWEEAGQGIPNDTFSNDHLKLLLAVDRILHGISLLESGNQESGTQSIIEARGIFALISKEFEVLFNDQ